MNTAAYIDSLAITTSQVDLENILIAVKNRVAEIKLEKATEGRHIVAELIQIHGYTALGLDEPKVKKAALASIDKYSDPLTGANWSGRGGKPSWLGDCKDQFLNPDWVKAQAAKKTKEVESIAVTAANDDNGFAAKLSVESEPKQIDVQQTTISIIEESVETTPAAINQPASNMPTDSATIIEMSAMQASNLVAIATESPASKSNTCQLAQAA